MIADLTNIEVIFLVVALLIIGRGLIEGLTVQEAGIALWLLGAIPVRHADRKRLL